MKGRWGERFAWRVSPEFRAPFPAVLCRGASGPERQRIYDVCKPGCGGVQCESAFRRYYGLVG